MDKWFSNFENYDVAMWHVIQSVHPMLTLVHSPGISLGLFSNLFETLAPLMATTYPRQVWATTQDTNPQTKMQQLLCPRTHP
jgi:hypothetical protein